LIHNVTFGSASVTDQFGFVGKGTVTFRGEYVDLSGRRSWAWWAKLGIFLSMTVVPFILFRFALGILPALLIVYYAAASPATLTLERMKISDVVRKKNHVSYKAPDPGSGKIKKGHFFTKKEAEAIAIIDALNGAPVTGPIEQFVI
jgi:hypothetical protein